MKMVLVVEDDLAIQEALRFLLELEGYSVRSARNGREALYHLRQDTTPCVILLDLMMPVMNGAEFCHELRRDRAFEPHRVVVMSADSGVEEKARALNAHAYVRKPLDVDAVLDILARYCPRS
jgi:two-component system, chemotaxis family, chemotaxis protein CheY